MQWFADNILRWICLFVLLWYGYSLIVNRGIPNIRTAPAIRKRIIALLKDKAQSHVGPVPFTVIDLGSGNGLLTREIARALPQARVIGLEISAPALAWSRFLRNRRRLNNLDYREQDFFSYNFAHADAIVMYLTIYQMEPIGKKLRAEARPGALITSNRFRLGDGWAPEESVDVKTFYPHQKTLHIYRAA